MICAPAYLAPRFAPFSHRFQVQTGAGQPERSLVLPVFVLHLMHASFRFARQTRRVRFEPGVHYSYVVIGFVEGADEFFPYLVLVCFVLVLQLPYKGKIFLERGILEWGMLKFDDGQDEDVQDIFSMKNKFLHLYIL